MRPRNQTRGRSRADTRAQDGTHTVVMLVFGGTETGDERRTRCLHESSPGTERNNKRHPRGGGGELFGGHGDETEAEATRLHPLIHAARLGVESGNPSTLGRPEAGSRAEATAASLQAAEAALRGVQQERPERPDGFRRDAVVGQGGGPVRTFHPTPGLVAGQHQAELRHLRCRGDLGRSRGRSGGDRPPGVIGNHGEIRRGRDLLSL